MKVDAIFGIHNIANRGFERVVNLCQSLQVPECGVIWIMDSSKPFEYNRLHELLRDFENVRHIHIKSEVLNKPLLLNTGIEMSEAEWVMCTDCDYIFSPNLLKICEGVRSKDRLLLKEVRMLPKGFKVTNKKIKSWDFPKTPFNRWGKIADGAMQYTSREWFLKVGGYDERMIGLCGMDNDLHARAKRDGLEIRWIHRGDIYHQWHPVETKLKTANQARRNWKIRDKDKTIKRNG